MKRLSLLTLTILLALGCQRSEANAYDASRTTTTHADPSAFTRRDSCDDADEWICAVEAAIVRKTNEKRIGTGSLEQVFESSSVARGHSRTMENAGISHNGFKERCDTLRKILPGMEFNAMAENVAWTYSNSDDPERVADELVTMWWNSQGHRDNMKNGVYHYIGVGVYRTLDHRVFATQIFH